MEQTQGVSGQYRITNESFINLDLYNASRNHIISHVEVRVTGKSGEAAFEREIILRGISRILPLSTGDVFGNLGLRNLSEVQLKIAAVYGCEA